MNPLSVSGASPSACTAVRMPDPLSSSWYGSRGYRDGMGPTTPSALALRHRWRRQVNLLNLSTPLGLAVAGLGRARVTRGERGLLLAEGYRLPFPVAGAFTIGNVLLTSGRWDELQRTRPGLLEHEEAHTWHWLGCAGLPFLPVYGLCLVWSLVRTGDRAAANLFERRAGLAAGGYREVPPRPLLPARRRPVRRRRQGRVRSRW